MNLNNQGYPEGYRLRYDRSDHAFTFYIRPDLFSDIRQHIAQYGSLLTTHSSTHTHVHSFVNEQRAWGYGSCMQVEASANETRLRCMINSQSDIESSVMNLVCTFSLLLEELNTRILKQKTTQCSEGIQRSLIASIALDKPCAGFCLESHVSSIAADHMKAAILNTTTRVQASKTIALAMYDVLMALPLLPETPMIGNQYGASIGLVSVMWIPPWRITLECAGSSLAISPESEKSEAHQSAWSPDHFHGAVWSPHNIDTPTPQLVLLAGLVTCEELFYL